MGGHFFPDIKTISMPCHVIKKRWYWFKDRQTDLCINGHSTEVTEHISGERKYFSLMLLKKFVISLSKHNSKLTQQFTSMTQER